MFSSVFGWHKQPTFSIYTPSSPDTGIIFLSDRNNLLHTDNEKRVALFCINDHSCFYKGKVLSKPFSQNRKPSLGPTRDDLTKMNAHWKIPENSYPSTFASVHIWHKLIPHNDVAHTLCKSCLCDLVQTLCAHKSYFYSRNVMWILFL